MGLGQAEQHCKFITVTSQLFVFHFKSDHLLLWRALAKLNNTVHSVYTWSVVSCLYSTVQLITGLS